MKLTPRRFERELIGEHVLSMLSFALAQRCILEAAVRLLRTASCAQMFAAQIAYSCGLADSAYFGLVFRKKFGQSPRAFAELNGAMPQMAAALPTRNSNRSPILIG